ncbi:MATE family efflux transporter, partial [Kitasatospora putterlickiae]|uniref:MATE family efflux transporter n=1 Tax=Kitasatospora putterlickiae TaxID=221725 RepID=UPI0031D3AC92
APAPPPAAGGEGRAAAQARAITAGDAPFGLDFPARMGVGAARLALVSSLGVPAVAGYGIGYRVLLIVTMALYAVRQGAAVEAARLTGAGSAGVVRSRGRGTAGLAAALGTGAAVLRVAAAVPVARLSTDDPAVGFLRMAALGGVHRAAAGARRTARPDHLARLRRHPVDLARRPRPPGRDGHRHRRPTRAAAPPASSLPTGRRDLRDGRRRS